MTPPLLDIEGLVKDYRALRPLRIQALSIAAGETAAIIGLDGAAAEVLVNLVTGAALPDAGEIRVFGRPTSAIADAAEWLALVDRFGIVSERAVLLEQMTVLQNLAMPFTLDIEPPPADVHAKASALAAEAGLSDAASRQRVGDLDPAGRVKVRFGRALALQPSLVLLEHATAGIAPREAADIGARIRRAAAGRGAAVLAVTADEPFAKAVADRVLTLEPGTGRLRERGFGKWFRG